MPSSPIIKINGVSLNSIDKINGIAKSSIAYVDGIITTQVATLSATKYGLYTAISTTSWTLAVNAASSTANSTSSLAINSQVSPTRTGTINNNTRINLQFDLSSFSTSSILSASLLLDVGGITTTATPNEVFVLDLGDTFDFPTLNNANYSLYIQSGSLTEYATNTIDGTGLYALQFNATALATASTYPAAYSMALLTYHDRNDIAPGLNDQYLVAFNGTPELQIIFQ
jgi:hypothetical protein